jgi:hypothetical protein
MDCRLHTLVARFETKEMIAAGGTPRRFKATRVCNLQSMSQLVELTLEGAITSKRKLLKLVTEKHVSGWDDPRYALSETCFSVTSLSSFRFEVIAPSSVNRPYSD